MGAHVVAEFTPEGMRMVLTLEDGTVIDNATIEQVHEAVGGNVIKAPDYDSAETFMEAVAEEENPSGPPIGFVFPTAADTTAADEEEDGE